MTNDPLYQRLLAISWRRPLNDSEKAELKAWLASHPQAGADWQLESNLNQALDALPSAPLPSNFTALVLAEVDRQSALPSHHSVRWRFRNGLIKWLPQTAFGVILLGAGLFVYRHEQAASVHQQFVSDLVAISDAGAMPAQVLTNFDAIRLMTAASTTPSADVQLLTLLQ